MNRVGNAPSSSVAQWEPSARRLWDELLQYDRSRDVEALSKCLLRLCFLLASSEMQQRRYERAKRIANAGGSALASVPSPLDSSGSDAHADALRGGGGGGEKRTTLATIECLLRAHRARLRLLACGRPREFPDEFVFRYPGRRSALPHYVSLCIEGRKSALAHARAHGYADEAENAAALCDAGFVVREPQYALRAAESSSSSSSSSIIETLQALPDHVQLAHDSPLLPTNVPASWLPPHCCTCRRIASLPTTLYRLPCCDAMYCCSADCWNEHAARTHQQQQREPQQPRLQQAAATFAATSSSSSCIGGGRGGGGAAAAAGGADGAPCRTTTTLIATTGASEQVKGGDDEGEGEGDEGEDDDDDDPQDDDLDE